MSAEIPAVADRHRINRSEGPNFKRMARANQLRTFDGANLQAARIIAADPDRYDGIMREWALLFLERYENPQQRQLLEHAA